jgi:hypothetical protein
MQLPYREACKALIDIARRLAAETSDLTRETVDGRGQLEQNSVHRPHGAVS